MNRGDVILADIPYSDRTGSKVRPAVIVSNDANNQLIDDVIVVAISGRTRSRVLTHVLVDPATPLGAIAGVLHISVIQCENIFILDKQFVLHTIGALTGTLLDEVNNCLKLALGLT